MIDSGGAVTLVLVAGRRPRPRQGPSPAIPLSPWCLALPKVDFLLDRSISRSQRAQLIRQSPDGNRRRPRKSTFCRARQQGDSEIGQRWTLPRAQSRRKCIVDAVVAQVRDGWLGRGALWPIRHPSFMSSTTIHRSESAIADLLSACGYRVALYELATQLLETLPSGSGCILLDPADVRLERNPVAGPAR